MNNEIAISITNLSKVYPGTQGNGGLTTLNDISLDIKKGEAVGIVGRNGAGKSTLLKILSGITKPSGGYAKIRGEVSSLLSIGAGLHPDLTGRENLKIMGSLSNVSNSTLNTAIERIIEFSELGHFIDAPVKTYSDGMYVRLMLSSFFIFPCDILLIDEVIAAGDAGFRAKCYRQFENMRAEGKTIVFVTHNMQDVLTLCTRAIYLDKDIKLQSYDRTEVVNAYLKDITSGMKTFDPTWVQHEDINTNTHIDLQNSSFTAKIQNEDFRLISAAVCGLGKQLGESVDLDDEIVFEFTYEKLHDTGSVNLILKVFTIQDVMLMSDSNIFRKEYKGSDQPAGVYKLKGSLPAGLLNRGIYYIGLMATLDKQQKQTWQNVLRFEINQSEWRKSEPWAVLPVPILPNMNWTVTKQNA